MKRGFFFIIAFAFVPLAACTDLAGNSECVVHRPPVKAGDAYLYHANGSLAMIYTTGGAVVHWKAVDKTWTAGNTAFGGILTVTKGATLSVRVADQPVQRLEYQGNVRPAYQIAYEVKDPAHEAAFHFVDEWVDFETGDLVAASLRATYDYGNSQDHLIRFMRDSRVPLLISGGMPEKMEGGQHLLIDSPPEMRGGPPARAQRIQGGALLDITIQSTRMVDGKCNAFVEIIYTELKDTRSEVKVGITAVYRDGVPLPVEYSERYPPSFGYLDTKLVLDEYHAANGADLPPWKPLARTNGSLQSGIAADGFLPFVISPFKTTFATAEQAIRSDEVAGAWLNSRPDAAILEGRHLIGDPSTDVVDQWEVSWADTDMALLKATATKRRSLLPDTPLTRQEIIQVTTNMGETAENLPQPAMSRVTLDELDRLSTIFYNEPVEFLSCDFFRNECWFGSHNATGWPRAGGSGGALPQPGLRVFLDSGWLFMEQSYAAHALDG